jgi:hypothetical protein
MKNWTVISISNGTCIDPYRSDNAPLLTDSGIPAHIGKNNQFLFELFWLRQDGFFELVKETWLSIFSRETSIGSLYGAGREI